MEEDASYIHEGGTSYNGENAAEISWVSYPHFFKKDNIIVLYVGENLETINALEEIIGLQFAGYTTTDILDVSNPELDSKAPVPTTDTGESLILVTTNGETTAPFVNLVWATEWTENGWIAADGFPLTDMLPEIISELPIIRYGDDFSVQYKDGVSFSGLSIFDNNFDRLHNNVHLSYLDGLPAGTYYIGIRVTGQGMNISQKVLHRYAVESHLYAL